MSEPIAPYIESKMTRRMFACPHCGNREAIVFEGDGPHEDYKSKCHRCWQPYVLKPTIPTKSSFEEEMADAHGDVDVMLGVQNRRIQELEEKRTLAIRTLNELRDLIYSGTRDRGVIHVTISEDDFVRLHARIEELKG